MKQRFPLPIWILILFSMATIVWKSPRSARMPAVESVSESLVDSTDNVKLTAAQEAPRPTSSTQSAPVPEPTKEVMSIEAILENTNPMKAHELRSAVQVLRSLPPEQVSAYFLQSLKELGSDRPVERDRLIMVANSLQLKSDLPLWEDLVKRQTPRYPEEEKLRNPPHPTLESRFIDMEQLQAIRNIGLLAHDDRAARRILMELILTPDQSAHRTLHREQAYIALKEADLAASLRVLKQLAADDDLLKRL